MYYIENDVEFMNGIEKITYGFHFISRYNVDYVNKEIEIQISSSKDKQSWIDAGYKSPFVNFYELSCVPNFNDDPINWILKKLVTKDTTVFYGLEVKHDYKLNTLTRF